MKNSVLLLGGILLALVSSASAQINGLRLVAHLDNPHGVVSGNVEYSGSWGYVAPDGREYALLTTATGTAIIDITDTLNVHEVVHITGPTSLWREVRTYRERAYVVTEAGGGTQIIDLSQLPDTATLVKSFTYTAGAKNTGRVHSLQIFDGYLYLNGCANWGTTAQRGAVIFSLADPDNPQFVGEYSPNYFHDSYVRNDTLYGASIYSGGGIYIADIRNKSAPQFIGKISYTGSGTHNLWTTTDGKYVISTDEIGSTTKNLKLWNLQALPLLPSSPTSTYAITPTDIGHNVFVRGNYAYTAWYTAGIAIADITDPTTPVTAGFYDTSTEPAGNYDGVWGMYPYFWSGKIIAGDMQNGLYVFMFDQLKPRTPSSLELPTDAVTICTSNPLTFQWTRVADPVQDPHEYEVYIDGASFDTTIAVGSDTSLTISDPTFLPSGTYNWFVVTKDEATEIATQDTFSFTRTPLPVVLSPNGGEDLRIGSQAILRWDISSSGDSVDLDYSVDGGNNWLLIARVEAAADSFLWTVPNDPTFEGKVRVADVDCPAQAATSAGFFVISTTDLSAEASWNLLSLPVATLDPRADVNFPGALGLPYRYNVGYVQEDSVYQGTGYWVKLSSPDTISLAGAVVQEDTIPLAAKWNLIGSITDPVDVASITVEPDSIVLSSFFGFHPDSGYSVTDSLRPGKGYWVRASAPGNLIMSSVPSATPVNQWKPVATAAGSIIFTDARGFSRTLRISENGMQMDELPPAPPAGTFDVRFASEPKNTRGGNSARIIQLQSAKFPVTVSWKVSAGGYVLDAGGESIPLTGSGKQTIIEAAAEMTLTPEIAGKAEAVPTSFELLQNYPNPFNPATQVSFVIGQSSFVNLKVTDVLGREVATLVNERKDAGSYSIPWDASEMPSGVYYCRLEVGGSVFTQKMVLIK